MYKQWITNFFIYGLIFCILFIGFNFIIDPYGIFGHTNKFSKTKNHIASERMTKLYYIKREQPKTILIGTSRIGAINPKYVEKYTKDNAYNLSLSASSIEEEYHYIRFLIEKIKIKNLIWGIDFFSFNPEAKLAFSFSQSRLDNNLYIKDYRDALLTMDAFFASLATLKDNIRDKQNETNHKTGQNLFLEHKVGIKNQGNKFLDIKIKEGLIGYKKTKELYASIQFKTPKSIDKNFIYIKNIVKLSKKHNVNIYLYTNPIYIKTLNLIYELKLENTYEHFQTSLATILPFWDFNENLTIILNKENFWDNNHMREEIGNKIIDTIFNKKSIYGNLINKKNISDHLEKLRKIGKKNE